MKRLALRRLVLKRAGLQPRREGQEKTGALAPEDNAEITSKAKPIGPASVEVGDAVIVSGDLGRHGVAILSVREGLEFESPILSDTPSCGRRSKRC